MKAALGGRYALVFGEGDARAALALVGEAPGKQEARLGRPFVGAAGKHLDHFLQAVDISREALYITNAVKFRPTRPGAQGRLNNRAPSKDEIALFSPWLHRELRIVSPKIVATLGNTALYSVTGETLPIGEVHGKPMAWNGRVLFPLYHPAAVIYRRELAEVYEADLRKLREALESVI